MPYTTGQGKTAVALFVDGLELQYVQLSAKGDKVTLRDFKTVPLAQKFEEKKAAAPMGEDASFGDAGTAESFAAPTPPAEAAGGEAAATNASVLLSLLGDLPSAKYTLSYALSEPAVTYQEFESNFGLKGGKLKKKLIQELSATRSAPPAIDSIDTIPSSSGGLLAAVREDGLQLYDLLGEVKQFLGGRVPNIEVMDGADLALMGLVRASFELQEEEVTIVVYVGSDFSRLIFLRGKDYLHFAPIISEGYSSPNIENTLYSRILLEQDNIALTRIDRILLAGESHKVNLKDSLAPQFSSALVDYLRTDQIDLSLYEGTVGEAISEYAVPIATAWKALRPKHPALYRVNLVPISIIEGQKAFKLAWHGWLAAALIIFSIVFFSTSIRTRSEEIRKSQEVLTKKKSELADLEILRSRRDALQKDIQRYSTAAAVYDSIVPGSDRWSRILHYLSNSVDDLNSVWLYKVSKADNPPGAILISGRSIFRTRIARLASLFEKATLKAVRTTAIRDKIIYDFDLLIEQVDKSDVQAAR